MNASDVEDQLKRIALAAARSCAPADSAFGRLSDPNRIQIKEINPTFAYLRTELKFENYRQKLRIAGPIFKINDNVYLESKIFQENDSIIIELVAIGGSIPEKIHHFYIHRNDIEIF